jgi:quinol monooxygenase YgiN
MVDRRQVLVGAAGAAGMLAAEAAAQTSPAPAAAPPESPYAVTYIEVEPARADASRQLLARYRDALKDKGPLAFAVFEQIGRPNHFAIVEQWPSAKAREDNAASAASREFRSALAPLLIAPYEKRPHLPCRPEPGRRRLRQARRHPRRHRAAEGERGVAAVRSRRGSAARPATSASMRWCRRAG